MFKIRKRPIQISGSDKDSDTTRLIYATKKSRRVQALRDFEKLFLLRKLFTSSG